MKIHQNTPLEGTYTTPFKGYKKRSLRACLLSTLIGDQLISYADVLAHRLCGETMQPVLRLLNPSHLTYLDRCCRRTDSSGFAYGESTTYSMSLISKRESGIKDRGQG